MLRHCLERETHWYSLHTVFTAHCITTHCSLSPRLGLGVGTGLVESVVELQVQVVRLVG